MSRYHINPKTGKPGKCSAKLACPYAPNADHYSSADAARGAYEKQQADLAAETKVLSKAEKREAKFREDLEPLVGVALARYSRYAAAGQKGFIEDSVAAAYRLQKEVFAKEPGSPERVAAVAARNEGLRQLLAADIAFYRTVAEAFREDHDAEFEGSMVRNARQVLAAHDGLEAALADRSGQREYARALRVQEEDVEYVIRRALKEYNEPRARQTPLRELAEDRLFTTGTARQIRVQPEDVTRVMNLALSHTPKL